MGTTADGFIFPDSGTNVTTPWQIWQDLANSIQTARNAERQWNSWTPSWGVPTDGGFNSVGAGGLNEGFYRMDKNKLVHAQFRIQLGTAPSIQTGTFVLILPVPAYIFGGTALQAAIGHWTARDNTGGIANPAHFAGTMGIWNGSSISASFNGATKDSPTDTAGSSTDFTPYSRMDSNDPVPWAVDDVLSGVLAYRAA